MPLPAFSVRDVAATAKRLEYAVSVDRDRTARTDGDAPPIAAGEGWSAEHLVLAGLCKCTLTSLEYHARRAGHVATGEARAHGVVTKRETDGRYAFVEVDVELDVVLDPPLAGADLGELLARAERDCFVGASLTAPPRYRWIVEGEETR
jgi:organic hydroperoxide reductase OsmC/OhrA